MAQLVGIHCSGQAIGTFVPIGYNGILPRTLLCDGSAVSRVTYAKLFAIIGTTYGVGDGSTTFNLPPPGVFLRGNDPGAVYDPDSASRTALNGGASGANPGSFQQNQNLDHAHLFGTTQNPGGTPGTYGATAGPQNFAGGYIAGSGGNQSNPNNISVNYAIVYE